MGQLWPAGRMLPPPAIKGTFIDNLGIALNLMKAVVQNLFTRSRKKKTVMSCDEKVFSLTIFSFPFRFLMYPLRDAYPRFGTTTLKIKSFKFVLRNYQLSLKKIVLLILVLNIVCTKTFYLSSRLPFLRFI